MQDGDSPAMLAALHGHDDAAVLMATEMAALGMHEALGAVDEFGDSIVSYAAYGGAVKTITYLLDRADLPDEALKAQLAAVNEVSDLVAAHASTRHGVLLVRGCAALACALASCPAAGSVVPPQRRTLVVPIYLVYSQPAANLINLHRPYSPRAALLRLARRMCRMGSCR